MTIKRVGGIWEARKGPAALFCVELDELIALIIKLEWDR